MQSSQPTLLPTYERRIHTLRDTPILDGSPSRRRRSYKSPELEMLADYGEGGTEPIRLQD